MSKSKTSAGMRVRRPGNRQLAKSDISALESQAEEMATKIPGKPRGFDTPHQAEANNKTTRTKKAAPKKPRKKVQLTAYVRPEVREELQRAAVALSGPPNHESITSIVERAIVRELEILRDANGGPFPETEARPRPGRRAV